MSIAVERRQISVCFFDIVNASGLSERLDPEDLRDVLEALLGTCEGVVRRHGGHVAQRLGDGLVIYFGYPVVREDDARRAVQSALETLAETRACSDNLLARTGAPVRVRIGIHTGPVVLEDVGVPSRPEVLAIGETPNKAARVQAAADPDSVLVSEATYRLVRGYFTFTPRGAEALKGFSEPMVLYAAGEQTAVRNRLEATGAGNLSPFVDRHEPFASLRAEWRNARPGEVRMVLVAGEPGIGKSRIVQRLRDEIEGEGAFSISCYCSSFFQSTALWPIADTLNRRLLATGAGSTETRLRRLREELETTGLPITPALPLLANLLGLPVPADVAAPPMTPQSERQATFQVLLSWMLHLTVERPGVLVVEDLHWVDPTTLELLSMLEQQSAPGRLMVLLTHRPEFSPPWQSSRVSRIELTRLDRPYAEELLRSVAGQEAFTGEIIDKLLERADGVPLYIEEIAKAVVESSGAGTRLGSHQLDIPATLQDSLAARLDHLQSGKSIAQLAATLGRTFDFELLRAVSEVDETALRADLDRLVAAQLLHRRGAPSNETFIFKHALIQDAAYGSLLRRVRQRYHERIVEALVSHFPETAEARPELLAHHYAGASRSREAIACWNRAGQRAMARSAFNEAIELFSRGLRELPALSSPVDRDKTEIELRSGLGLALISTRGWAVREVEENYNRARQLCESFGDVPVQVLYGIWGVHAVRADLEPATRVASMFRELLSRSEDVRTRVVCRSVLGALAFFLGRYADACGEFDEAVQLVNVSEETTAAFRDQSKEYGLDAYLYAQLYRSHCQGIMGQLTQAAGTWREALSWVEPTRHPFRIATVLAYGVTLAQGAHDGPQAVEISNRLAAISSEHGFHHWLAIARCGMGWAAALDTGGCEGIDQLQAGLQTLGYLGAFLVYPHYASYLAEAQLLRGDLQGAEKTVEDALAVAEPRLGRAHEPWLYRLKGEIRRRSGDISTAIVLFKKALGLAVASRNILVAVDTAHQLGLVRQDDPAACLDLAAGLRVSLAATPDHASHPRFRAAREWLAMVSEGSAHPPSSPGEHPGR
jgi:class 3 adenylate cyclase/tetratricopeptide (TPR) repeat protein